MDGFIGHLYKNYLIFIKNKEYYKVLLKSDDFPKEYCDHMDIVRKALINFSNDIYSVKGTIKKNGFINPTYYFVINFKYINIPIKIETEIKLVLHKVGSIIIDFLKEENAYLEEENAYLKNMMKLSHSIIQKLDDNDYFIKY